MTLEGDQFDAPAHTWPAIPLDRLPVTVGRAPECDVRLAHPSISRLHVRFEAHKSRVVLVDGGSRFGTTVNSQLVQRVTLSLGDVVRIGSSPLYRFNGRALEPTAADGGMSLRIEELGVRRNGRDILRGVNAEIEAGELVGVLGPSGAGKSLLTACLSSAIKPTTGQITYDSGIPVDQDVEHFRNLIGIVEQEDLVFTDLTVEENLRYAAAVRLPAETADSRRAAVNSAMQMVGLEGKAQRMARVLSGGERKRLSVAVELLRSPRLLLLDEPTSGLDPGTAAKLIEVLRRLTRQGMTVICATHTMSTLHFFDTLLVLGRSQEVSYLTYHGPESRLLERFGARNFADLFDRLASMPAPSSGRPLQGLDPRLTPDGPTASTSVPNSRQAALRVRPPMQATPSGATFRLIVQVTFERSLKGMVRDRPALATALAQPVALALLIVFSRAPGVGSTNVNFFLTLAAVWLGMSATVREIVKERSLYTRDRLAGLPPRAYALGKLLFGFGAAALSCLLLLLTFRLAFFVCSGGIVAHDIAKIPWLIAVGAIVAVGLGGAAIGLLLSALSRSQTAAVSLLPLALLPQMLFSRVAAGDGVRSWRHLSPYAPLAILPQSYLNGFHRSKSERGLSKNFGRNAFLGILSLPMLTRPSTAAVDMARRWPPTSRRVAWIALELGYLGILVAGWCGVYYVTFMFRDKPVSDR